MSTYLEGFWAGGENSNTPIDETDVSGKFKGIREEITGRIKELPSAENQDFAAKFTSLVESLASISTAVDGLIEEASEFEEGHRKNNQADKAKECRRVRKQLNQFADEVRLWRLQVIGLDGKWIENERALFADAGRWAMHFSMVRMTLSTFIIGLAWGVVVLNWEKFRLPVAIAAGVLILFGFGLLWFFTRQTIRYSGIQKKSKARLVTVGYSGGSTKLGWKTIRGIRVPQYVYFVAMLCFFGLLYYWWHQADEPGAVMISSVELSDEPAMEFVTKVGQREYKFQSVEASRILADMDKLSESLEALNSRILLLENGKNGDAAD